MMNCEHVISNDVYFSSRFLIELSGVLSKETSALGHVWNKRTGVKTVVFLTFGFLARVWKECTSLIVDDVCLCVHLLLFR